MIQLGMIGSLGDIVFTVSMEQVRTFDELTRSAQGRWAKQDRPLQKPLSEFLGPDLDTISFQMRFDAGMGVNPRTEMDKVLDKCRSGVAETLIIGKKPLGMFKWVVKSAEQSYQTVDNAGNVLKGTVSVSLEEYMGR